MSRLPSALAAILSAYLLLTKSMLDDQFSTQYDEEREALLEPAEETAQLRQGSAGFARVQIRVRRVELGLRVGVVLRPCVSVRLRMGVAVGVDSAPPG